jgi:small subunit ribosomal protein S4
MGQLVRHGHITVNGRKVSIPSYVVQVGDVIGWKEGSKSTGAFLDYQERANSVTLPSWLSFDPEQMTVRVLSLPRREDLDLRIQEQNIVEFYSR